MKLIKKISFIFALASCLSVAAMEQYTPTSVETRMPILRPVAMRVSTSGFLVPVTPKVAAQATQIPTILRPTPIRPRIATTTAAEATTEEPAAAHSISECPADA